MSSKNNSASILHIAVDEKFIDAAYETYEKAFPGQNHFLVLMIGDTSVKHLDKQKPYEFISVEEDYISYAQSLIQNAKIVVFHSMSMFHSSIANSLGKTEAKLVWSVFGYEVYLNKYLVGNTIYGKETYKNFINSPVKSFKQLIRPLFYKIFFWLEDGYQSAIEAFRKMDFVSILYDEEFQFYKELGILNKNTEILRNTYYPREIIIKEDELSEGARNILLGNSASFGNNHLEAFEILNDLELKEAKIITPLSYGNKREYTQRIIEAGNNLFEDRFIPLTDFMPLQEYQNTIQQCGVVIMNHYRQQAVGNVLNTLFMGAKVYLSKRNTLYHYLKRIGCTVFCIEEELNPENKESLSLLTSEQIQENRKILEHQLSLSKLTAELHLKLDPFLD